MPDLSGKFRGADGIALAEEALALMRTHNVPATPANYEMWVNHLLGLRPDLSLEINARIEKAEPFTDDFNEELFERHFASTRLSVQVLEASETIARELADVAATLRDAGAQTTAYSGELGQAATSLENCKDTASLKSVVAQLASATRDMARRNTELSQQMSTSARQVESLQATLQTVRVEALTDSLTGLGNRKQFDAALKREVENADGGDLCLLMCDIDHFKRFNDTWGHLVGDQVIRFISHALRTAPRGDGLATRYGGEEFAIILPRTDLTQAAALASSINNTVKSRRLSRRSTGEAIGTVTVSIGVAKYRPGEHLTDLIARADACLYESKRNGRDRVTVETPLAKAAA